MDSSKLIATLYENIKSSIQNKGDLDKLQVLKKDMQELTVQLSIVGKENQEQFVRSLAMEGYLALLTAKAVPITVIEKKNILQNAFDKLKPYALKEQCLFIFLRVQNLLCNFLIHLGQNSLAREILENMEDLYDKISQCEPNKIVNTEDLFTASSEADVKIINQEKIDNVITNNIEMQAYLYGKLNIPDKYALYSHTALRRQLEMKEGTPKDWALRAARLGNYFTCLNQMGNARHHLCAANYVLKAYHNNCRLLNSELKHDSENHFCELSHHWVKYGLTLFKLSKKAKFSPFSNTLNAEDAWKVVEWFQDKLDSSEKDDDVCVESSLGEKEDYCYEKTFSFPNLDISEMESKVPVNIVKNAEEAQALFSFTYKWLKRAKQCYDFENHSAEQIACSLQLAELFEHFAFFEKDIERQYLIQKKRADVLEALNSVLKSCDHVTAVQIDVIRELSQVQLELMALNLQKLWREESSVDAFSKDNESATITLENESVKSFTDTLNVSSKNTFLKKLEAAMNANPFRQGGYQYYKSASQSSFGAFH